MSDFTLTPVWKEGIRTIWQDIQKGVQCVVGKSEADTGMTRIYNDLIRGALLLWEARIDGAYIGYCITCLDCVPFEAAYDQNIPCEYKALHITHAYAVPGLDMDIIFKGQDTLNDHAWKCGCTEMKFKTMRPFGNRLGDSFIRRLNPEGDPDNWHTTYVEVVRKVTRPKEAT